MEREARSASCSCAPATLAEARWLRSSHVARSPNWAGETATLLTSELAEWADLILVMSPSHLSRVRELGGGENAALITSFAELPDAGGTGLVPDPVGASDQHYLETFEFLEQLIARAIQRLEPGIET
jgi:protein-tyrosine-phosphatase